MRRILRSFEQPRLGQQIKRSPDLIEIVPDVRREPVVRQQRTWMTVEKEQQVEIARMAKHTDAVQQMLEALSRHERDLQ
jgi:antirestriction protein ArdC